jgi:hypothetical protein
LPWMLPRDPAVSAGARLRSAAGTDRRACAAAQCQQLGPLLLLACCSCRLLANAIAAGVAAAWNAQERRAAAAVIWKHGRSL